MNTCRPGRPAFRGALDAFDDLLAAVPVSDGARADLRRRMAAPGRRYHGPRHLALLWARHLALGRAPGFHEPRVARLVASAIAFHDAVLEPGRAGNERASAALWREAAAGRAGCAGVRAGRMAPRRTASAGPLPPSAAGAPRCKPAYSRGPRSCAISPASRG